MWLEGGHWPPGNCHPSDITVLETSPLTAGLCSPPESHPLTISPFPLKYVPQTLFHKVLLPRAGAQQTGSEVKEDQ